MIYTAAMDPDSAVVPDPVPDTGSGSGSAASTRRPRLTAQQLGLGIAVAILLLGMGYMWWTDSMNARTVRDWLDGLGPAAPVLFVGAFIAGALVGLPGMAFVTGANLAFGPWLGFVLAYGGGLLAVTVPFVGTRALRPRGATPWRPRNRHAAFAFTKLESHPFLAVFVLRLILWFNAPLTYALALSPIRTRSYLLACAAALAPVVAAAGLVIDWFL